MTERKPLLLCIVAVAFVTGVGLTIAQSRSESEEIVPADNSARMGDHCLDCHASSNPGLLEQWQSSAHFKKDVGCADCHGSDHSKIFTSRGRVSSGVCARCHEKAYGEFLRSKHAEAEVRLRSSVLFQGQPDAVREEACLKCHRVGLRNDDGSVGRCNYCHMGHSFSAAEAREPESCALCHVGPDYPQWEAFEASKHGILHRISESHGTAPSCSTCHMPGGTHDDSANLTLGTALNGSILEGETPPVRMETISLDDFKKRRALMVETCSQCHSVRFSEDSLAAADAVKSEANGYLAEAVDLLQGLHKDGLLDRPPHEVVGGDPHSLTLGPEQVFETGSEIEQTFYRMFRFHYAQVFKGAYHQSPTVTNRESEPNLKQDLAIIKEMARRLRSGR